MAASMAMTLVSAGSALAVGTGYVNPGSPYNKATANLGETAAAAQIQSTVTLPQLVGRLVNVFLGILGVVFLVLAIYAGYKWMTAQGDEKAVGEAKTTLTNSIIGLIIIAAAYSISSFVINGIFNAISD